MPPIEGAPKYIRYPEQEEKIKLEIEYLARPHIEIVGVNGNGSFLVVDGKNFTITGI